MKETCAGIGAASHGFQHCGIQTSIYNDHNAKFSDWLKQNGKQVICGDINDTMVVQEMAKFPGLFMFAGVSCQPFSFLGDGRQQYDDRSKSLTGTLRASYLMQIRVTVLECTPGAQESEWVQHMLQSFASQTGYRIHQQQLDLHTYWVSKRTRWWCTISDPMLKIGEIPPIPKLKFCPSGLHLFPKMMDISKQTMNEIELDLYELRHFHGYPHLSKHLIDTWKTLPTATHSWGSQVKACSCGCRSTGFNETRLAEKGLYGVLILLEGEIRKWNPGVPKMPSHACL